MKMGHPKGKYELLLEVARRTKLNNLAIPPGGWHVMCAGAQQRELRQDMNKTPLQFLKYRTNVNIQVRGQKISKNNKLV